MSSIKFACDCGKAYKVPEKFAGKKVKCKQCGEPVRVPEASTLTGPPTGDTQRLDARAVEEAQSKRMSKRLGGHGSVREAKRAKTEPGAKTESFEVSALEKGVLKIYAKKKEEEFERGEGRLTFFVNEKPKKAYKLGKKAVVVGRSSDADLVIDVGSVSNEHFKVEYKLGHFVVQDSGSTNGLLVNGRRVRRASLKDGDILQAGEAVLRIDCG